MDNSFRTYWIRYRPSPRALMYRALKKVQVLPCEVTISVALAIDLSIGWSFYRHIYRSISPSIDLYTDRPAQPYINLAIDLSLYGEIYRSKYGSIKTFTLSWSSWSHVKPYPLQGNLEHLVWSLIICPPGIRTKKTDNARATLELRSRKTYRIIASLFWTLERYSFKLQHWCIYRLLGHNVAGFENQNWLDTLF